MEIIYQLLVGVLLFMSGFATSEFVRYYKSIGPMDGGGA